LDSILRFPARAAIAVIRLYQMSVGRMLGQRCRFHPSCSHYAVEAIESYGLIRGGARAFWRVARCGPWTAGGLDPVRAPAHSGAGHRG
jgi:uncharacterized protein